MCGLITLFYREPSIEIHHLGQKMLKTIKHRGPDDTHAVAFAQGTIVNGNRPADVVLGLNRLAIHDLSQAGRQPMCDPSGRYWIVFNGEIYNYRELREELQACGERFSTGTDTEVLLRMLVRQGADALPRMDGMFAFVFFDSTERRVLAVRDRFGIKPLYLWRSRSGDFCLASEIKAFTEHPQWQPRMNRVRAYDFLSRGLIDHTCETLFEGVTQLRGGQQLEFSLNDLDSISETRWYELKPAAIDIPKSSYAEECRRQFDHAVGRRLRADVTVGSCLSGGIDSSAIVCAISQLAGEGEATSFMTFTARSEDISIDEWPYAQEVAARAGVKAIDVHPDGSEFLDQLHDLVWVQDEPFSSSSIFAQFCVFRAAHEHGVTVMLDGQGADEQFAGYHAFFKVRLLELMRSMRLGRFSRELRDIAKVHGYSMMRLVAQTVHAAWPLMGMGGRRSVRHLLNPTAFGDHLKDPFNAMTGQGRGVQAFSIDQLLAGSLPMLLHWEDRNSMCHGIEARVPFLSHHLVEFALGLPSEAKICGSLTKVILRRAMQDRLPRRVLERTDKIAFSTPEAAWLCRDHTPRTRELLASAIDYMGNLLGPTAGAICEKMLSDSHPYDNILWRIICFGAWMERFKITSA